MDKPKQTLAGENTNKCLSRGREKKKAKYDLKSRSHETKDFESFYIVKQTKKPWRKATLGTWSLQSLFSNTTSMTICSRAPWQETFWFWRWGRPGRGNSTWLHRERQKRSWQSRQAGFLPGHAPLASGRVNSSPCSRAPYITGHLPSVAQANSSPQSLWQPRSTLHISICPLGMAPLVGDHWTRQWRPVCITHKEVVVHHEATRTAEGSLSRGAMLSGFHFIKILLAAVWKQEWRATRWDTRKTIKKWH